MAARVAINLLDTADPAVTHVFNPFGDDKNGVHVWTESTPIAIGDPRLTMSLISSPSRIRQEVRLTAPVVATEVINGVSNPRLLRSNYFSGGFSFHNLSTPRERADLMAYAGQLYSAKAGQLYDMIVNKTDVW